jgi:hypothetical protein
MATQWQGALLWWSFDPRGRVEDYVEENLKRFVAAIRKEHSEETRAALKAGPARSRRP